MIEQTPRTPASPSPDRPPTPQEWDLLRTIRGLAFGAVEVTIHNGRIVQITRSEKQRYD